MSEFDFEPEQSSGAPEGAPDWMVTFADLMSLLLTFFVLLLSFSNMEVIKFATMAGTVRNSLGLKSEFDLSDVPMGHSILPYQDPKEGSGEGGDGEDSVREELRRMLKEAGLEGQADVRKTTRGVLLDVEGDLLFDSGQAELKPVSYPVLERLAAYVSGAKHFVDVQGHSDSIPISTAAYPSNWELSAARAGRAVRFLVDEGVPAWRLRAIGLADTAPMETNETTEGRANNRRVEFLFVPAAAAHRQVQTTVAEQASKPTESN